MIVTTIVGGVNGNDKNSIDGDNIGHDGDRGSGNQRVCKKYLRAFFFTSINFKVPPN